jgi:hypothetical protein
MPFSHLWYQLCGERMARPGRIRYPAKYSGLRVLLPSSIGRDPVARRQHNLTILELFPLVDVGEGRNLKPALWKFIRLVTNSQEFKPADTHHQTVGGISVLPRISTPRLPRMVQVVLGPHFLF